MFTTFSQSHLGLLDTCPRKFQQTYLEQLTVPPSPEIQAAQRWGDQFHLLMQQRELGLPIETLPEGNGELRDCLQALLAAAPDLFDPDRYSFRQSEHLCSLRFGETLLVAVYDLLLLAPQVGLIVDWKTYLEPKSVNYLTQQWQTRLYLYLLVETSDLKPDQVSFHYWFVRCRDSETGTYKPQQVIIKYSSRAHRRTQADLQRLTQRFTQLSQLSTGEWPKVDPATGLCDQCPFAYRCHRRPDPAQVVLPIPALVPELSPDELSESWSESAMPNETW